MEEETSTEGECGVEEVRCVRHAQLVGYGWPLFRRQRETLSGDLVAGRDRAALRRWRQMVRQEGVRRAVPRRGGVVRGVRAAYCVMYDDGKLNRQVPDRVIVVPRGAAAAT